MAGAAVVASAAVMPAAQASADPSSSAATASYLVSDSSGTNGLLAATDVVAVGAQVLQSLTAANAVLVSLTPGQVDQLESDPTVTVTPNLPVTTTGFAEQTLSGDAPAAVFPQQSGATALWAKGDTGAGVNVAVVDTGIDPLPDFSGRLLPGVDLTGGNNPYDDQYGHGTFVAGLIAGNGASSGGQYKGEAPGAGLVPVKVAGANGQTSLATVIAGIDWVIAHRAAENISVMNLSLGYEPYESTAIDPLAQAVEKAWEAGIVVVVSAGNDGPYNGTILSPGDDPLVVTVGAINDHGSTSTAGDVMASFSSVGPTNPDGWYKPDLVTSGTSVVSLMAPGSTVAEQNPQAVVGSANFVGSGTSFSSAITAGAAALLLQKHPMSPDTVKADLLGSATAGPVGDPFVDGHGLLNVAAAATSNYQLQQDSGQVAVASGTPNAVILPGETIQAGFTLQMPGNHRAAAPSLYGGQVDIPVACSNGGVAVGLQEVDIPTTTYELAANAPRPSTSPTLSLQGSTQASDLCSGGLMYTAGHGAQAYGTGEVLSNDTQDQVQIQFQANLAGPVVNFGNQNAVPVPVTQNGSSVDLGQTWTASTWDPALWHGLPGSIAGAGAGPVAASATAASSASTGSADSGSWSGSVWNGSVWNGHVWNGSVWNGHVWNGSVWNSTSWDGHVWNGSVWNGSVWNGHVWNGSSWGPAGTTYDDSAAS